jgi:Fe-S-cluster containining protein
MSKKDRPRLSRAAAIEALEDLYAQLPSVQCKGLCFDSCTSVHASKLERKRMEERGVKLPPAMANHRLQDLIASGQTPRCPALGPVNNCTVYELRPYTCRAFGVTRHPDDQLRTGPMMCDHGCPADGEISIQEYVRVLREIEEISEAVTGVSRRPTGQEWSGTR